MASRQKLASFFDADSFCIIGASTNPDKPGGIVAANFANKFPGKTYLVNPKGGELNGLKLHRSVLDIPDPIDVALIIVPARYAPDTLEQCGEKGIRNVIITTGGFAEIGEEGERLQARMLETMRRYGISVIGPNCLGIYAPSLGIDTTFLPEAKLKRPGAGRVSIFTQSGAFGAAFLDELSRLGTGRWIRKFVSYGNASDVNEADCLEHIGEDPETDLILIYLEDFKEGRRFIEKAMEVSKRKPIMGIKANRTETGARAGASHTAAISSDDAIVDDLMRSAGIMRAVTWDQLKDSVLTFATQPLPRGERVAIVTDGGGAGVMASDMLSDCGLELAELTPKTLTALEEAFPPYYSVGNPIDLTGNATAEDYRKALEAVYADPDVDSVINISIPCIPGLDVDAYVSITEEIAKKREKPVVTAMVGGEEADRAFDELLRSDIPVFKSPGRAVQALGMLTDYVRYLERNRVDPHGRG
jgi:acyl-CoA synthetase (NDP forming)